MPRGNDSPSHSTLRQSLQRYGADRWGGEFLHVNDQGHLVFGAEDTPELDLQHLAETLTARGIRPPYLVRFPTMITARMRRLSSAFARAVKENDYKAPHIGAYPIKVNQRRTVVETVVAARERHRFGLEVGSKPELLLAMSQPVVTGLPLICNGFKDREYIRMAHHAAELGHLVVIVVEGRREAARYVQVTREHNWSATPQLGVRAKLYSKGSGRWKNSGGEGAKFGLTSDEILAVIEEFRRAGIVDRMTLLHFHAGSQITQIKRIKQTIREGMRLWGGLWGIVPQLQYLDIGGGAGVDYDGSRTSYPSSANYSLEEYASQVVFEIHEVARSMRVPHPTIITESGRTLVASHSVTITNLREVQGQLLPVPTPSKDSHRIIAELRYTLDNITSKNIEEYFHDAVDYRYEALLLFSKGYLSFEDRASAEGLFQRVRLKCADLVQQMIRPPEEIVDYLGRAAHKYLANFSVFQSLPDAWSIDHVFPACPLARHDRKPNITAQIVDITCDSDGAIRTFAHPDDNLEALPLHHDDSDDSEYYLGFFMTGAYQDSLGSTHNLFSRCHEITVRPAAFPSARESSHRIEFEGHLLEITEGMTNEGVLETMGYDNQSVTAALIERHVGVETSLRQPWALNLLRAYPYLER
ncbi:MAG: biosynthetic arginine decarboxylase [Nannocystaceae bacterium]